MGSRVEPHRAGLLPHESKVQLRRLVIPAMIDPVDRKRSGLREGIAMGSSNSRTLLLGLAWFVLTLAALLVAAAV